MKNKNYNLFISYIAKNKDGSFEFAHAVIKENSDEITNYNDLNIIVEKLKEYNLKNGVELDDIVIINYKKMN